MITYTPGPWSMKDYDHLKDEIEITNGQGVYIASIDVDGQYGLKIWDEIKADARLIAAAPDLYEALAPFAALLKPHHNSLSDDTPLMGIEDSVFTVGDLRKARAALSKTEGKS